MGKIISDYTLFFMKTLKFTISFVIILLSSFNISAQIFVDWNSEWSYFKGLSEPSQPSNLWVGATFNDSGWLKGNAPFRYGDGSGGTELNDMMNRYTTLYIRKHFIIENIDNIDELLLTMDFDDGFVVWINGKEVAKLNVGNNYAYNSGALTPHEFGDLQRFVFNKNDIDLLNGKNTIAIQGFNVGRNSTDFYLAAKLEGKKYLPETEGIITADKPSGFYKSPFTVKLTSDSPGGKIKYTLDGSDPKTGSHVLSGISPVSVRIAPNIAEGGRGQTGGVVLRASTYTDGFAPGKPTSRSYIFTAAVKSQTTHPGGSWPTNNVNGQTIDLPMDTKVTGDKRYENLIESSLLNIPTISITTDPDNLFNPQIGIYVNAEGHGDNWERPANIELINPDGSPGFNIDAGIRIRGGWSRHGNYPKHAFRLFFRKLYGKGKLDFPLFGDEGTNEFDKVDLRTSQNYSWANGGDQSRYNTMNRDVFSRESQRDMKQPYSRSRYYHLYLNGLYWGVYQTQERAEANFAESYFGGSKDDYDVIKVDIGENFNLYEIEATDGNTDSWKAIWNMCQQGFASNANYFKLIGLSPTGAIDTSLNVFVDVDNLIDYMLIIFYGGNFDSPVSKFSGNYNPNNFFIIDDRTKKRDGFRFFIHDAEHTLLKDPVNPGIGINENRVNIGRTNDNQMNVTYFGKFHPQWLHFKLTDNAEYRMRFADRVYRHFFNSGALTADSCISRFKKTADMLDLAIIAESARWGDAGSWPARTKDDDWIKAVNQVTNDYMPYRTNIVLQQIRDEKLYVDLKPPIFKNNGVEIIDDKIIINGNFHLLLENKNSNGTIAFTTDGTDPRAVGGAISSSAVNGGNSKTIDVNHGTIVKARIKSSTTWSALHEIIFEDSGLFANLKVTELHYHPADQGAVNDKELEFIELKNIGETTLDLSGLAFTDGISYTFPIGTTIAPKAFVVAASNPTEFKKLYGISTIYGYSGSLSNGGERVELQTASKETVLAFTYDDSIPWPVEPDGSGYSLISAQTNPTGDPNQVEYWAVSKNLNGSPMADDENSITTDIVSVSFADNFYLSVYPNPSSSSITIDLSLNNAEKVDIGLYDMNGRLLQTLVNQFLPEGFHNQNVQLNSLNINAGMYLIVFRSENNSVTKKLIYNN